MAAITVTAASVARVDGEVVNGYLAGATITAGMAVYVDSAGAVQIGTNATSAGSGVGAQLVGIALNGGASGQPIAILKPGGTVNIGDTVAVGKQYCLGTAGGIIPVDDIATGEYITTIGVGITAANIKTGVNVSGVQAAGAVS
jgi:hypothetical protein